MLQVGIDLKGWHEKLDSLLLDRVLAQVERANLTHAKVAISKDVLESFHVLFAQST